MCISLDNIFKPVQQEMDDFELFFSKSLVSDSSLLNDIIEYILTQKGKRIRPLLVFLSASASRQKVTHSTFIGAASIEMLHTATLLHDDVVDEANERRGKKSVMAVWNPKAAVLVGDYLLAKALSLITDNKLTELLEILASPIAEMSEGELIQIEKSIDLNTSEAIYFKIIKKKTASLMASAMSAGVYSVCDDKELTNLMRQVGEYLGIAFQIRDDIFDYQQENSAGKPIGNDILERKITLPLLCALKRVTSEEKKQVIELMEQADEKHENIISIRNFVINNGGLEEAQKIAESYSEKAINLIEQLEDSSAKWALVDLAKYIVQRNK